jgi:cellulose synthase/poly-beta-1,6-N-acetylglucosamine synthase-like glycosyltransferase
MDALALTGWILILGGGFGLVHSYVLYPFWWKLRSAPASDRQTQSSSASDDHDLPSVSVIVAAYNEERHIGPRIENLIASDYPKDRLEILIASDGSGDDTVTIAQQHAKESSTVRVLDFQERRGKISVLNDACEKATGSILVFSDANVAFEPTAIRELVRALGERDVGCACGRLVFRSPTGAIHEQSEGLYWRMETWLKTREGTEGALLGANGAIYAMKADLWTPCPPDTLVDDFFIPMRLLIGGHKVVYAPDAVAEEDLPPKLGDEFGRRIRIGAGNFQALTRCWKLLNPLRGLPAWVFFSHKVLRWLGPFLMLMVAIGSTILASTGQLLGWLLLLAQFGFYGIAVVGLAKPKLPGPLKKVAGVASHFVAMNAALLIGFLRWLGNSQRVTWNRTRR